MEKTGLNHKGSFALPIVVWTPYSYNNQATRGGAGGGVLAGESKGGTPLARPKLGACGGVWSNVLDQNFFGDLLVHATLFLFGSEKNSVSYHRRESNGTFS